MHPIEKRPSGPLSVTFEACRPFVSNENPNLGHLANNGGPTFTRVPNPPSMAIDAIPNGTNGCGTTLTTDLRGAPRPINRRCDTPAPLDPA